MSSPLRFRARKREREHHDRLATLAAHRSSLRQHYLAAIDLVTETEALVRRELDANGAVLLEAVDVTVRPELSTWSTDAWANWRADTTTCLTEIRVGSMRASDGTPLGLPIVFDLAGSPRPVVIVSRDPDQRAHAHELLASLVVRITACFPKQVRLALLDPANRGLTFPMSRRLDRVLLGFDDLHLVLDELRSENRRISSDYLDRHHPDFDSLPRAVKMGETRQVALAASAPAGFDANAIESLIDLAGTGSPAGIHTIVHVDLQLGDEAESLLRRLIELDAVVLDLERTEITADAVVGTVEFDDAPSGAVQELVFQRVAAAPRRDLPVAWEPLQDFDDDGYWQFASDDLISAAVGRAGADDVYDIWFGHDPETTRTCTHGILIGAAPTGRQFVFDNLLAGLTTHFSPDELRLFLVEGQGHASFASWTQAPHSEVVALAPSAAQAKSALRELRTVCEQRVVELQRSGFSTYRGRRQDVTLPVIPRWLALIDGYEQVLADDSDGAALDDLRTVISLGERVGVHVVLGGSRFDEAGPLHRSGLFDQLDLRISLQPFADDTLGRDEFGIKGARLVQRVCDRPFRAVVNSTRGHDDANLAMQLASLDPNRRDQIIGELGRLARQGRFAVRGAHVMNGAEQPQLIDNPLLAHLLELPRTAEAVADFARSSEAMGGLGIDDWIDEEHPLLMFVGREETLRGQAHFVLRRRPTENVLVVMGDRNLRIGTLAALLVSSALVDPDDVEFWIADRGASGTPAGEALEHAVRRIARLDVPSRYTRSNDESAEFIAAMATEVARRRALSDSEVHRQPTSFLVLVDPERISSLNRVPTAHGTTDSEVGLQLRYVLMQGPAVGVHGIITSSALAVLSTVLSEPVIHHELRHRLVTRLAEEDSFALVRSSRATGLTGGQDQSASALLFDSHSQSALAFKPYSVAGSETGRSGPLSAQLTDLFDRLTEEVGA